MTMTKAIEGERTNRSTHDHHPTLRETALALASARVFLRACDHVGERAKCFGRPRVENHGALLVGDDLTLTCTFAAVVLRSAPEGVIAIGNAVSIDWGTLVDARGIVSIGDSVTIGPYCVIADTDPSPSGSAREARRIVVGDGVRLGAGVTLLPGARIGAGAVVKGGSTVSGEVAPGAVVYGTPARPF